MHTMTIDRNEIKFRQPGPTRSRSTDAGQRTVPVRINNCPSPDRKSFKYLLKLVVTLTKDSGWLYKEDLEHGFNQARYLTVCVRKSAATCS